MYDMHIKKVSKTLFKQLLLIFFPFTFLYNHLRSQRMLKRNMAKFVSILLLATYIFCLNAIGALATLFLSPTQYEQWETGSKVRIHLKGGSASSADLQLVDTGGFFVKNLGFLAKDFEYKDEQVFEFVVWDELPSGNTYQLAFHPKLDSGKATTAFSQPFSIVNKNDKMKMLNSGKWMKDTFSSLVLVVKP
ncbi:hypothetical protein BDB00DRAFT_937211 [Zychaea mexicana]|uniref:uncharacterized protein n=1 Tax=Zychaea mexicana TaxID=64656 RepID=UPI0022FE1B3F|nr:uncharacterized protein BDB00DRAFT_937211 [Zychaea mexicana]KAI9496180.1 hypothetical protein BDB00DRAFT_937211 [Zychaea mexicana]